MSAPPVEIEGASLEELKALSPDDREALLAFGRPIAFRMGSASILAEFNRDGDSLHVNPAQIDGGGEGVRVALWKLIERYAGDSGFASIRWNVHALTCAVPNPRLQRFLRANGFSELDDEQYGRIFMRNQLLEFSA